MQIKVIMRYHATPIRMVKIIKRHNYKDSTNVGKGAEQLDLLL